MHDIAVNNIKPSKNSTGQATNTYLNLTVTNQGDFTETFNLTLYVDTTAIQTENITLQGRNSAIIVFLWNTTGFALGNYTISAYAWPVLNETSTADNNVTDGWILVTIPGDVDGNFKVDMGDISVLCDGFGSTIGADGNYWHKPTCILCPHSPNFDIDWNGRLDMGDIVTALDHFGQRYP
jgi:hypothetical protein